MLNGKIQLDDGGYYYNLFDALIAGAVNERGIPIGNVEEAIRAMKMEVKVSRLLIGFHDFIKNTINQELPGTFTSMVAENGFGKDIVGARKFQRGTSLDINRLLLLYHIKRFMVSSSVSYKIRPKMVDFFESSKLDFPGRLFLTPHDEFMISLPVGSVETELGSMLNIYVSTEAFDYSAYENESSITTQKNISDLIANNPGKIKRMIRCYAICYDKNNLDVSAGKTVYYQLPILEDEKIYDQFMNLMDTSEAFQYKSVAIKMFDVVLKFCAYLIGSKCPDMVKVPASIRQPKLGNPKKQKQAERHNATNGYDFFDVGRICQSNPSEVEYIRDAHGVLKKHFKVRRHYRAQWYGAKSEANP